jgi:ABC-type antimicrobial peptide transport system permease subunit
VQATGDFNNYKTMVKNKNVKLAAISILISIIACGIIVSNILMSEASPQK